MRKAPLVLAAFVALATVATAWAQPEDGPNRRARGRRVPSPRPVIIDQLTQQLDLTAEQRTELNKIVREHAQRIREQGPEGRDSEANREYAQKMRELRNAYREAQKDGDEDKARQLRKQMDELRLESPQYRMQAALLDEVEKILTPEQKKEFEKIKPQLLSGRGPVDLSDPNMLRLALRSLELTPEQDEQIRELFRKTRGAERRARTEGGEPEDRREIGRKLLEDVNKVLTPEQQTELKEWRPEQSAGAIARNPRMLKRSVEQLDLTGDQKSEIAKLFEAHDQAVSQAGEDREARNKARDELYKGIMDQLTDEQKEQLRQQGERRGPRGVRGPNRPAPPQ